MPWWHSHCDIESAPGRIVEQREVGCLWQPTRVNPGRTYLPNSREHEAMHTRHPESGSHCYRPLLQGRVAVKISRLVFDLRVNHGKALHHAINLLTDDRSYLVLGTVSARCLLDYGQGIGCRNLALDLIRHR